MGVEALVFNGDGGLFDMVGDVFKGDWSAVGV